MRITVIIATTGRAALLRETVNRLAHQTRKPDSIVVSAVSAGSVDNLLNTGDQRRKRGNDNSARRARKDFVVRLADNHFGRSRSCGLDMDAVRY